MVGWAPRPKAHVFGHIHRYFGAYDERLRNGHWVRFIKTSVVDDDYMVRHFHPVVLDVNLTVRC